MGDYVNVGAYKSAMLCTTTSFYQSSDYPGLLSYSKLNGLVYLALYCRHILVCVVFLFLFLVFLFVLCHFIFILTFVILNRFLVYVINIGIVDFHLFYSFFLPILTSAQGQTRWSKEHTLLLLTIWEEQEVFKSQ